MANYRETLPATFESEAKAAGWAGHLTHPSIIQEETRVIPSKVKPGRWQVQIRRRSQEQAAEVNELI